jgi:hypothetical protein
VSQQGQLTTQVVSRPQPPVTIIQRPAVALPAPQPVERPASVISSPAAPSSGPIVTASDDAFATSGVVVVPRDPPVPVFTTSQFTLFDGTVVTIVIDDLSVDLELIRGVLLQNGITIRELRQQFGS